MSDFAVGVLSACASDRFAQQPNGLLAVREPALLHGRDDALGFLVAQLQAKPFASDADNLVALSVDFLLVGLLVVCSALKTATVVEQVAALPGENLTPQDAERAAKLIALCNGPLNTEGRSVVQSGGRRSAALDGLLREVSAACEESTFLAGDSFSTADACLLPFLWRIEKELSIPEDCQPLRDYIERAKKLPCFAKTVVGSWWWWW